MAIKLITDTQGAIVDEKGDFFVFNVIKKQLKNINYECLNYPILDGGLEFKKNVLKWTKINNKYEVIATGGSGHALSMIINKFNNFPTLFSDICWHNYYSICDINKSKIYLYDILKQESLLKNIEEILKNNEGINIILNDPIHNPTGLCMNDEQYIKLSKLINSYKHKNINLIWDPAYVDYLEGNNRYWIKYLDLFNCNKFICFSFSKTFTLYGARIAGLIFCTKEQTKLKLDFLEIIKAQNFRISNIGLNIVNNVLSSKKIISEYKKELAEVKLMLKKRRELFFKLINNKLEVIKNNSGFFITIIGKNVQEIYDNCVEFQNILRIVNNSLRVGICGITLKKIPQLVKKLSFIKI